MTLSFHEIGLRWPDAVVLWDRDVAPALDWEPRFVERDGVLWAVCDEDVAPVWFGFECYMNCRCRVWEPTLREWWEHERWDRLRRTTQEWKREYLGQWIDETQHFDNDTIRAIAYGADRAWRTGHSALDEGREIARGRWPTLRRILGRNQPR